MYLLPFRPNVANQKMLNWVSDAEALRCQLNHTHLYQSIGRPDSNALDPTAFDPNFTDHEEAS